MLVFGLAQHFISPRRAALMAYLARLKTFMSIYILIARISRTLWPGHVVARLAYEKQGPEDAAEAD